MRALVVAALSCLAITSVLAAPAHAHADDVAQRVRFTTPSGVTLAALVEGRAPLVRRPTVVELTPYGEDAREFEPGADVNYLTVQLRGTGDSTGRFDALGPQTQQDVVDALAWACRQPWSDGRLAVVGFSASAVAIYNSLHRKLPCVRAAVLRSGTFELYRDLLVPGGVPNTLPTLAVMASIGGGVLASGQRDAGSAFDALVGVLTSTAGTTFLHPTLDTFWSERGFRGDVNRVPTLLIDGVFDVSARGPYAAYRQLRSQGTTTRLLVVGAHDGAPRGTDFGAAQIDRWLDRWVLGRRNGVERDPAVQMLLADGDRLTYLDGQVVPFEATDWPVPGTTWTSLSLSSRRAGLDASPTDGSLALDPDAGVTRQSYLARTTLPTQTDPGPISAIDGGPGGPIGQLATWFPAVADVRAANREGLTFTSPPLASSVLAVGPAALELTLSTSGLSTPLWAVVSDVWPDGTTHPLSVGRLSTAFPGVVEDRSHRVDGDLVMPYNDVSRRSYAFPGTSRRYHVEIWPLANRFKAGHRIQVSLVGQSGLSAPTVPTLNTVTIGGSDGARLLFPTVPGSDLQRALR